MYWHVKAMVIQNGKEYNPCGSDYGIIYRDLKTVKGVYNRIKNSKWRKDVIRVDIYRGHALYDNDSFIKMYSFVPVNLMTF